MKTFKYFKLILACLDLFFALYVIYYIYFPRDGELYTYIFLFCCLYVLVASFYLCVFSKKIRTIIGNIRNIMDFLVEKVKKIMNQKKSRKYYLYFLITMGLSLIFIMNKITLDIFYNRLVYYMAKFIMTYIVSFILINYIYNILYIILGKIMGLKIKMIYIFPFIYENKKIYLTFSLFHIYYLESIFDFSNINNLLINEFIKKKSNSKKITLFILLIISFMITYIYHLSHNIYLESFVLIYIAWYFSYKHIQCLHEIDYNKKLCFQELIFSKYIDLDILQQHYQYLIVKFNDIVNQSENSIDLLYFVLICFRHYNETTEIMLQEIDRRITELLSDDPINICIQSRSNIFDYILIRAFLLQHYNRYINFKNLQLYIMADWGIQIPSNYVDKYSRIISLKEQNKTIKEEVRSCYQFFLKN